MNHLESFENWKRFQLLEREDVVFAEKWKKVANELLDGLVEHIKDSVNEIVELRKKTKRSEISASNKIPELRDAIGWALKRDGYLISTSEGKIQLIIQENNERYRGSFLEPNQISIVLWNVYHAILDVSNKVSDLLFYSDNEIEIGIKELEKEIKFLQLQRVRVTHEELNVLTHELTHYHDSKKYDMKGMLIRSNARIQEYVQKHETMENLWDYVKDLEQKTYVNSNWEYNAFFIQGIADLLDNLKNNAEYLNHLTSNYANLEKEFLGHYIPDYIVQKYSPETLRRVKKRIYELWTKLKELKE